MKGILWILCCMSHRVLICLWMHRVGYYPETILDFVKASSMLDIRDTLQQKKKKRENWKWEFLSS